VSLTGHGPLKYLRTILQVEPKLQLQKIYNFPYWIILTNFYPSHAVFTVERTDICSSEHWETLCENKQQSLCI